jgi:hypothetical protein
MELTALQQEKTKIEMISAKMQILVFIMSSSWIIKCEKNETFCRQFERNCLEIISTKL